MTRFRRGEPRDLAELAAVQAVSPEAAQWDPADYLGYDLLVATEEDRVIGFLVSRRTGEGERELLNLAVTPEYRRRGVARALAKTFLDAGGGTVFLEVRESNESARKFYKSLGFKELIVRQKYYDSSDEAAIVMQLHS